MFFRKRFVAPNLYSLTYWTANQHIQQCLATIQALEGNTFVFGSRSDRLLIIRKYYREIRVVCGHILQERYDNAVAESPDYFIAILGQSEVAIAACNEELEMLQRANPLRASA